MHVRVILGETKACHQCRCNVEGNEDVQRVKYQAPAVATGETLPSSRAYSKERSHRESVSPLHPHCLLMLVRSVNVATVL